MENETFYSLLKSLPHWEFELFLMAIFDGLIGVIIWPRLRKFWDHHEDDDQQLAQVQKELAEVRQIMGLPFRPANETKPTTHKQG